MAESAPEHEVVVVHFDDGEPCVLSPLDHGDMICVHGKRTVEMWRSAMTDEPPC